MKVLGFDPSLTHFGWALAEWVPGDAQPKCLARGELRTSASTLFVDRYRDLQDGLRALVRAHPGVLASAEYSVFGETYSEGMYGVFLYMCEALRDEKCSLVLWSPFHLKAQARDFLRRPAKWRMTKSDMIDGARRSTGVRHPPWSEHQADAWWAALTGCRFWLLQRGVIAESDLTPLERAQFTEVRVRKKGALAGTIEQKGALHKEDKRFFLWGDHDEEEGQQGQGDRGGPRRGAGGEHEGPAQAQGETDRQA